MTAPTRGAALPVWRLALPILWFGMIAAISFIEAPLKFQAPGITIPLGLGIGRLVFFALNIAEGLILAALIAVTLWPRVAPALRATRGQLTVLAAVTVVYLAKVLLIRPPLNARTDLVLAGADPGQSPWHYIYIAADVTTMVLLVVLSVMAARRLAPRP
ncbi:hypothetical protein ACFSWE_14560 [Leucobacter albus]|uniref:Uncharacterized protein n=1 Tax=Leucobacter albus TaxID=272210 RepID=A0ABW3TI58_9MICO